MDLPHLPAPANEVLAVETTDEDFIEDLEEEDESQFLNQAIQSSSPLLHLPSKSNRGKPSLYQRALTLISDAALSFLAQQNKHGQSWRESPSLCFFASTSRHVERMFAICKLHLERNSQFRIELLSALVALHDLSIAEICGIWENEYDSKTCSQAKSVLTQNPKNADIDSFYLSELLRSSQEECEKQKRVSRKRGVEAILSENGFLEEGKRATKKHLIEFLAQKGELTSTLNKFRVEELREKVQSKAALPFVRSPLSLSQ